MLLRFMAVLLAAIGICAAAQPGSSPEPETGARQFPFNTSPAAVDAYRKGWIEILEFGRWTEAERLYREAVAEDPSFAIGQSVLGRITVDGDERDALYESAQTLRDSVRTDGLLILDTYQKTLELFALRENGSPLPTGYRETMAHRAVRDYGRFHERYPDEWSVMIEYIEWVHALEGAQAALNEIARLRATPLSNPSFSYFPAYFLAELGQHEAARKAADTFIDRINDPSVPQVHYINAYLAFQTGDRTAAHRHIERTLTLEPRHLIAARLKKQIDEAMQSLD